MSLMNPQSSGAPRQPPAGEVKRLTVQYYALLREQAGRREEALVSGARTPRELYAELSRRYPFSLGPEALRVAINSEFSEWSTPLADGDAVVFIPPVAGGGGGAPADSMFRFTHTPIDPQALRAQLADPSCAGYAAHEGYVRDSHDGMRARPLESEAFE